MKINFINIQPVLIEYLSYKGRAMKIIPVCRICDVPRPILDAQQQLSGGVSF